MSRVKKISIAIVAVLMMIFAVLASTSLVTGEEREQIKKVSVIVGNQIDSNIDDFKRGIEEAANATRTDIDYIEMNEEEDGILEYIMRESESGVQAMILLSGREQVVREFVESDKRKIPLVLVNSDFGWQKAAIDVKLSFDGETMAKELAEKLEKEYGKEADVVLLTNGTIASENTAEILQQVFERYSFAVTRMKNTRNAVRRCLEKGEEKKILIGCSVAVTEQAALYSIDQKAVLIGIGYSDEILQKIREGKIDGVMAYSMYSVGICAMQSAVAAVEKKETEHEIRVPCRWITKENMKSEYDFLFPVY